MTVSLRLADKSGTFAKRQSLGDHGGLPEHIECHILSMVSGISVEGGLMRGVAVHLAWRGGIREALPYKVISL